MEKLFNAANSELTEKLIDGQMYYLFDTCGYIIGQGCWERDNNVFYDNDNDVEYIIDDAQFIMPKPSIEQLLSL